MPPEIDSPGSGDNRQDAAAGTVDVHRLDIHDKNRLA